MIVIALIAIVVLVGIDQLSKYLIVSNFELHETMSVIKFGSHEIFNFTFIENKGASWGVLHGKTTFLVIFTSVIMIALIVYLIRFAQRKPLIMACLALFIGGGIGNLIDRIFRGGAVVDFIEARFIDFPVFNFADICVTIGAALFFIEIIISEVKKSKKDKAISRNTDEQV